MPDRQRHDEFIWALIFSLIINLLFIAALATQRYVKKSSGLQPFIVSIAANQDAPSIQPAALTSALSRPLTTKRAAKTPPTLQPLPISGHPLLPTDDASAEETLPQDASVAGVGEETSPGVEANATATPGKESADGMSIFRDKIAAGNYTAPEYLTGEKPPYPQRAERNGWEGTVLLTLLINANGEVAQVGIAKTSGYDLLDRQACESVSTWRFKPARHNGLAIAATVQQPIIFRPAPPKSSR